MPPDIGLGVMLPLEDRDIEKIAQFQIFEGLRRETINNALTNAWIKNLKHREYIYRAGDAAQSFCLVLDGAIKLIRHSPRGEDIIMHFALQGELVGALLMNQRDQNTYPISAKSMGVTRVLSIPKEIYRLYWQTQVDLQSKLNVILYKRMSNIQDDKTMSTSPLRVRMANLLMRHLDRDDDKSVGQPLSISLTRQEIADSLGVAVESVIRIMREWQDDGTIHKSSPKGPELIDIKKLLFNFG